MNHDNYDNYESLKFYATIQLFTKYFSAFMTLIRVIIFNLQLNTSRRVRHFQVNRIFHQSPIPILPHHTKSYLDE